MALNQYPNTGDGIPTTPFGMCNVVVDKGLAAKGELALVPNTESLAANKTIAAGDPAVQFLSPTAARNVTMPATTRICTYLICNMSATYALTVKDAAASTIGIIQPSTAAFVISDGTTWKVAGMSAATADAIVTFTQTYTTTATTVPNATYSAPTQTANTVVLTATNIASKTPSLTLVQSSSTNPSDTEFDQNMKDIGTCINTLNSNVASTDTQLAALAVDVLELKKLINSLINIDKSNGLAK